MKYNELKNKGKEELRQQDMEMRAELFQLQLKKRTDQLSNKSQIRRVRKDIARIQTMLSELQVQK